MNLFIADMAVSHGVKYLVSNWIQVQTGLVLANCLRVPFYFSKDVNAPANYAKVINKFLNSGLSAAITEGVLMESGYDLIKFCPTAIERPVYDLFVAKPKLLVSSCVSSERKLGINLLGKVSTKFQELKNKIAEKSAEATTAVFNAKLFDDEESSLRDYVGNFSGALGSVLGEQAGEMLFERATQDFRRNTQLSIDKLFREQGVRPTAESRKHDRDLLNTHYNPALVALADRTRHVATRLGGQAVVELVRKRLPAEALEAISVVGEFFNQGQQEAKEYLVNNAGVDAELAEKLVKNIPFNDSDLEIARQKKYGYYTTNLATLSAWGLAGVSSGLSNFVSSHVSAGRQWLSGQSSEEVQANDFAKALELYLNDDLEKKTLPNIDLSPIKEGGLLFFVEALRKKNEEGFFLSLMDKVTGDPGPSELQKAKFMECLELLLQAGVDPSVVVHYRLEGKQTGVSALHQAIASIKDADFQKKVIDTILRYSSGDAPTINCQLRAETCLDFETPLSLACYLNKPEVVEALLGHVPLEERIHLLNCKNRYGQSAFDHAIDADKKAAKAAKAAKKGQKNSRLLPVILEQTELRCLGPNPRETYPMHTFLIN